MGTGRPRRAWARAGSWRSLKTPERIQARRLSTCRPRRCAARSAVMPGQSMMMGEQSRRSEGAGRETWWGRR